MGARKDLTISERAKVIELRKDGWSFQRIAGIILIFRFF